MELGGGLFVCTTAVTPTNHMSAWIRTHTQFGCHIFSACFNDHVSAQVRGRRDLSDTGQTVVAEL